MKRYKFVLKSLLDYRDSDEIKRNRFNIIRLIYNMLKKTSTKLKKTTNKPNLDDKTHQRVLKDHFQEILEYKI